MTKPSYIGEPERLAASAAAPPAAAAAADSPSADRSHRSGIGKVFSFPVMCVFLFAAVIFAYAPRGIGVGEPDIWWRLRSASELLQHHKLSRIDNYSFTAAGLPWTNFEWLSDLLFLLAYKAGRLQGLIVIYAVAMVAIFAGAYYRAIRAGADCKDATIVTVGGICLAAVALAPRPLVFGWLCLTVLLLILDRFQRTGKSLWLLPPLFAIWINLHGSWIYGLFALGITLTGGLIQGRWGQVIADRWTTVDLRKLLIASGLSVAALFLNPFGYRLVLFPLQFVHMPEFMQYVEYWRPVDFGTWNGKLAMCLIFAIISAALFSKRSWPLRDVLLLGFALWSGLLHVRFLDFAAIISVPLVAPRLKLFPPYDPELEKPWLNAVVICGIVTALVCFFPSENQLQKDVDSQYPTAALAYMHQHHINGRIFSPAEFGGFTEWNAPDVKSFSDGRAVFVEKGIFQDGMRALLNEQPHQIMDKYQVDYVLLERKWPLASVLDTSPNWRLIYSDNLVLLFQRSPETAGP